MNVKYDLSESHEDLNPDSHANSYGKAMEADKHTRIW